MCIFISQDALIATSKQDIHSAKVLGEGAFGLVDLVVVDSMSGPLLCVRKKLLKQNDMNNNDPALEVSREHISVRYASCASHAMSKASSIMHDGC